MTTAAIRQKLHSYLEVADDKKVKAIYAMMQEEIEEASVKYSEEFARELDQRHADYKKGRVKMISAEESHHRIQEILRSGKKK